VWKQYVNACTGFGLVKGATVMASLAGMMAPDLSAFSIYTPARVRRDGPRIEDEGAKVSDAVWAWNRLGACTEELWPSYTLDRTGQFLYVNEEPFGLKRAALAANGRYWRGRLPIECKRILATGDRLMQRVLHSLHLEQYCLVALPVGLEFGAGRGVIPPQEPTSGWHLCGVIDWRYHDGEHQGLIGNSWGATWGDGGFQWASFGLLAQAKSAYYIERVG
jgi:hypothetical protein